MLKIVGIADGEYVHTHRWANYFARKGHKVHLVSFTKLSDRSRGVLHPTITIDDWTVPAFHLKRFWITADGVMRLRRILRDFAPHLVHAHFLSFAAWYAGLADHRPLVVSVMGVDIEGTDWRPRSRREQLLTPFTLRRADLAVCWSSNLQRVVKPMLRSGVPCEVVFGGVDLRLFSHRSDTLSLRRSLDLRPDDFVIFSPRLFRPLTNIDTVVEALSVVLKRLPQARLVIVKYLADQYPEYGMHIDRLIDELSVRPFVRFVPAVAHEEMPSYFSAADCTVSIPETDGTPMTIMESAACETPVVIQDLPDYEPTVFLHEQTVLRVPRRNSDGLAAAILRLASEKNLRDRLRLNGRKMVERHCDYGVEMGRLEQMYESLVATGHGGLS